MCAYCSSLPGIPIFIVVFVFNYPFYSPAHLGKRFHTLSELLDKTWS